MSGGEESLLILVVTRQSRGSSWLPLQQTHGVKCKRFFVCSH